MIPDKQIAAVVGFLFATTMIAGLIDSTMAQPMLGLPLAQQADHRGAILLGVFMTLYLSLGVVGIALLLHPVLSRHHGLIASAYVAFRCIECVLLLSGALVPLFLLALGQEGGTAGAPAGQLLAAMALRLRGAAFQLSMAILGLNSLLLCGLLFRTRLIPRWLAAWGFIGYAGLLASAVLDICGVLPVIPGGLSPLYLPGGLFELVALPAWLILRGFNPVKDPGPRPA
jgi:hypothetical protein